MIIGEFQDGDAAEVVALWEAAGLIRPWNDPYLDIERKKAVQRDLFLVAVDGDRLLGVGMAGYDGHRGWVNYLAVRPDARQLGIGRALMAEFERRLLDMGARRSACRCAPATTRCSRSTPASATPRTPWSLSASDSSPTPE